MNTKYRNIFLITVCLALSIIVPSLLYPQSLRDSPHGDKTKLPKGCYSCHKGHGVFNTPMLPESKDSFCYRCHGESSIVMQSKRDRDLGLYTKSANLEQVFRKPYRHPIENTGIHRYGETLPEIDSSIQRHAACSDCHHHHYVTTANKMTGIKGVTSQSDQCIPVEMITFEYELCFKCHACSANLPPDQKNKAVQFNILNPSFHPVMARKNNAVPSLLPLNTRFQIQLLDQSTLIKCTHCHNNDDYIRSKDPNGPHGSIYRYILAYNFTEENGLENPYKYELCYSCHRRESILSNESFFFHNHHITAAGISCRSCHEPHGSTRYTHLIDFRNFFVSPSSSGRLDFIDLGSRAGECYLKCHVNGREKDHNPSKYPVASSP